MSDKPRKKVKAKRKRVETPVQKFKKDLVTQEKQLLQKLRLVIRSLNEVRNQRRRVTIIDAGKEED